MLTKVRICIEVSSAKYSYYSKGLPETKMNSVQLIFYWLRWLLLLPLSIGIGLAVSSVFSMIASFAFHSYDLTQFNGAARAFIISFVSIILSYVIAPKYKIKAVMGLYCLWFFIMICCLILVMSKVKLYGEEWEIKDGGIALSMVILGLAFSYVILFIAPKETNRARKFGPK